MVTDLHNYYLYFFIMAYVEWHYNGSSIFCSTWVKCIFNFFVKCSTKLILMLSSGKNDQLLYSLLMHVFYIMYCMLNIVCILYYESTY